MQINGRRETIEQQIAVAAISGQITEPTLADLFSDPITWVMMDADHVEYMNLGELLRAKRAQICLSPR